MRITKDAALEALRSARDKRGPSYTYPRPYECVYVEDDGGECVPSCIVGEALVSSFGIDPKLLAEFNAINAIGLFPTLEERGVIRADYDAVRAFQRAQEAQDVGVPWGGAVEEAENLF